MEEINLWEAVRQMRKLSSEDKTFSFSHATLDRERNQSHGVRYVHNARLRPAARKDDLTEADHKLFYYDEDLKEPRVCWQILIMSFENKTVVIN